MTERLTDQSPPLHESTLPDVNPIIDISPLISPSLAVFPGDTPYTREVLLDMARGDHITLSTIRATLHLGAHADGVNHYGLNGAAIDRMALDLYLGPCRVVHAAPRARASDTQSSATSTSASRDSGHRLSIDDLGGAALDTPRILLRTDSVPDPNRWNDRFTGVEPALIDHLADHGVKLIGLDTPSVDTADSKDLPAHARCFARGVAIVEGLVLAHVEPGIYEFIGLPLRLHDCDASPIRAVLRRAAPR